MTVNKLLTNMVDGFSKTHSNMHEVLLPNAQCVMAASLRKLVQHLDNCKALMFLCCKHMLHKVINSPRTGASTDSMTIRPWLKA